MLLAEIIHRGSFNTSRQRRAWTMRADPRQILDAMAWKPAMLRRFTVLAPSDQTALTEWRRILLPDER
jgi:hypothetical protein